jgi:hypothetical protein
LSQRHHVGLLQLTRLAFLLFTLLPIALGQAGVEVRPLLGVQRDLAALGQRRELRQPRPGRQVARVALMLLPLRYCRACADEALAARQSVAPARAPAAQPAPIGLSPRPLIAQCRFCRDEALGGTSTGVGAPEISVARPASAELLRRTGPR